jgi:hypothetical protein
MLPRSNVELIEVAGGESSEDYDQAEGPATVKWSGAIEANLIEESITQAGERADLERNIIRQPDARAGMLTEIQQRYLDVVATLPIEIELDDTVTWRRRRDGSTESAKVRDIKPDNIVLGFIRYILENG